MVGFLVRSWHFGFYALTLHVILPSWFSDLPGLGSSGGLLDGHQLMMHAQGFTGDNSMAVLHAQQAAAQERHASRVTPCGVQD